jgi:hypothetical protein
MYEFKPWTPPWWERPDYMEPDPEIENQVHESYREEVEAIKSLLLEELAQAQALFTGKNTACVLTTFDRLTLSNGIYGGHALETAPGHFITAVKMALDKIMSPTEKLAGIYVAGRELRKEKHVMPSPADYDALSARFLEEWGPTIIIVDPHSDEYRSVWASVHAPEYGVKRSSNFAQVDHDEIEPALLPSIIAQETRLNYHDAEFIAHLRWVCAKQGIEVYLTGSASGRGEISGAIKDGYTDIDLLVVADSDKDKVEEVITEIAARYFGPLRREPMSVNDWERNRTIDGTFLYDASGNKKIQLHIGHAMAEINFRPSNLERNFYHRVC